MLITLSIIAGIVIGGVIGFLWTNFMLRRLKARRATQQLLNKLRTRDVLSPSKTLEIARAVGKEKGSFKATIGSTGLLWIVGGFIPGVVARYFDLQSPSPVDGGLLAYSAAYLLGFVLSSAACWLYRRHAFVEANVAAAMLDGLPDAQVEHLRARFRESFLQFGSWVPKALEDEVHEQIKRDGVRASQNRRLVELTGSLERMDAEKATLEKREKESSAQSDHLLETLGMMLVIVQKRSLTELDKLHVAHIDQVSEQISHFMTKFVKLLSDVSASHAVFYVFSDDPEALTGYPLAVSQGPGDRETLRGTPLGRDAKQLEKLAKIGQCMIVTRFEGAAAKRVPSLIVPIPYVHGSGDTNLLGPFHGLLRIDAASQQPGWEAALENPVSRAQVEALAAIIHGTIQLARLNPRELYAQATERFLAHTKGAGGGSRPA